MENKNSKNDTILVWFDAGPYAYIHFGVSYALSKLGKFDFVGIVATKQDVDFLQNQNLINFKKLFYYPECYQGKSSYDLNTLKEFERKYDLDLWLNIFTDRFFHKYYTHFHHFTKNEILSIAENSAKFFINILDEFDPKLIFMQTAGEDFANLLLYKLAKKLKVKILMTNIIHLHDKISVSNNLISREISEEFQKLISNYDSSIGQYDLNYIKNQSLAETVKIQSSFTFDNSTKFQKISHYAKRLFHDPEPIYQNLGKTKSKMLQFRYKTPHQTKKRQQFLEKNSSKTIDDENFLYFPLHTEPEAKTSTTAPFFTDQISLIENIARSIPIDFLLYVKEHPIQKYKFWRSIQDYERIIEIPNVKLFHPSVPSQDLILKSKGVIAITGSTAFETLFFEKPVFLFTDEYYDVVSMVKKIQTLSQLPKIIKDTLENFQFNNNELNAITQASLNTSIPFRYSSMMKDGILLSSLQRNTNDSKITFEHFQKFYKNYETDFELLAKTISDKTP